MMKKSRKGFTIVELVIVIAVIAVLAAVLIPTFIHLVNKANRASDESLVTNLNKALAMREQEPGDTKNNTMHDAVLDLEEEGYKLSQLLTKSDQKLLWNDEDNRFCLEDAAAQDKAIHYWQIVKEVPAEQKYSLYAGHEWEATSTPELTVGFDAGYNSINSVTYKRTGDAGLEARIRTEGGKVTVDAEKDTVYHYGKADKAMIEAVASASYHEKGQVPNIEIKKGRVEIAKEAEVSAVVVTGSGVKVDSANSEVEVKVAQGVEAPAVTGTEKITNVKLVTSLSDLVAGDSVVLDADLNGQQSLTVNNVTLDLNGHTIKHSGTAFLVYGTGAKLVGGGLVQSTGDCGIQVSNGGELEIADIRIEAQEISLMAFTGSKLTINSGTFTSKDNAVIGTNGTSGRGGNIITINGGVFNGNIQSKGYIACGIYAANNDTWTVNKATFNIKNGCGILGRSGSVTVGKDVVINVDNDLNNPVRGKVGDSKVMVLTGAHIVKDLAAGYPGGTPTVTNNSAYAVTTLEAYA